MVMLNVATSGQAPLVVYVTANDPVPVDCRSISPVEGFIVPPLLILKVPPAVPVTVGTGLTSVWQKEVDA